MRGQPAPRVAEEKRARLRAHLIDGTDGRTTEERADAVVGTGDAGSSIISHGNSPGSGISEVLERLEQMVHEFREYAARVETAIELVDARLLERVRAYLAEAGSGKNDAAAPSPATDEHLLLIPTSSGYRLQTRRGAPPSPGTEVPTDEPGLSFRVVHVGASPLPEDIRRCAFAERV